MKNKLILLTLSLGAFYLHFNRNDHREIESGIVSPADGTIEKIENNRIDIFIGLTDVHFQRAAISGIITDIQDYPEENKNIIVIDNKLTIIRLGGILARSVRTSVKVGDYVEKGQIIGRILLGSHASIYPIYDSVVKVGDHVLMGQTLSGGVNIL